MTKYWLSFCCLSVVVSACEESNSDTDSGAKINDGTALRDHTGAGDSPGADGSSEDLPPVADARADMFPQEGLFVHAAEGQDLPGHGTAAQPFKTIQHAIDQAQAPTTIHVAAGTYKEEISLRDQVSLLGGYSASDWSDRDPQAWDDPQHRTAILAPICIAVKAGKGVGETTLLEGFYVEGGYETHDHRSHGMYIYEEARPLIRSNTIHGGYGDTYSTGITTTTNAIPTIVRNVILGGDAPVTCALRLNETTALVANNLLLGGAGTEESYGVVVSAASPVIVNNTIDAGTAVDVYGFFLFTTSAPKIDNNIVIAAGTQKGYGIYEATLSADTAQVKNNDFFACTTALYHDWGGSPADLTDLAGLHALSDTAASGNIMKDPKLVSATNWHLQSASPVEVRQGGLDQSSLGLDSDMDGAPRTTPWSMGAYEQDP